MKKLIIVDDRIDRLNQYSEFKLGSYDHVKVVTEEDFKLLRDQLQKSDTASFDQYDCVAFHRSAVSQHLREAIRTYCEKKKKPLIFFSGGITSSVYKDDRSPLLMLNSKEFYSQNLKLFIEALPTADSVNLLMLQFGHRWRLSMLLNIKNRISVSIARDGINQKSGSSAGDTDKLIVKRLSDLAINSLILPELKDETTDQVLAAGNSAPITSDHLRKIASVIDHKIHALL